ncbi:MAG: PQQ-dependent sugar dehydrogenase, partial [Candidatus Wallbacteria bacterium]|nr:PQQ-dependent sugar dehydrogenase [Candidatus Wallbacteria bacterium]
MLRRALIAIWLLTLAEIGWATRPARLHAWPYQLVQAGDGFSHPVQLTHAGDGSGRQFVVEQEGRVVEVVRGAPGEVFLDLRSKVEYGGECGLLSIAFHPRFRENGRCCVNYTAGTNGLESVISELTVPRGARKPDPKSERILLRLAQPYPNHNGGLNVFGPDGFLYTGFGDGGSGGDPHGNGQNLGTLLGKMLRLDVDRRDPGLQYAVPPDNPFVRRSGARPEIWAYGLRNPWRFSFDRVTGALWCGDVGQNRFEEIDVIEKGKNYGWNVMEGSHCFKPERNCATDGLTLPVKDYGRKEGV